MIDQTLFPDALYFIDTNMADKSAISLDYCNDNAMSVNTANEPAALARDLHVLLGNY